MYTLRTLVFRVVGFLARLSHVCLIHSSSSTRRRLEENPNCSSLFVLTLETCFRLVYDHVCTQAKACGYGLAMSVVTALEEN